MMLLFVGVFLIGTGAFLSFGLTLSSPVVDQHVMGACIAAVGAALVIAGVLRHRRAAGRLAGVPHDATGPYGRPQTRPTLQPSGSPIARMRAFRRMMRARASGTYELMPSRQPRLWVFSLIYLVSPIDVLPEFLPIIGVADDTGVLVWLVTSVLTETGRFLTWERTHRPPVPVVPASARDLAASWPAQLPGSQDEPRSIR